MGLRAYDVSSWGFFRFHGPDVKKFLQGLVSANVDKLAAGECLPACVLTPKGLLVADCELYEEAPGTILAVTRPQAAIGFLAAFEKKIMLSESSLKALRSEQAWLVIGEGFARGLPWPRLNEPARLLLGVDPPEGADFMSDDEFHAVRVASGFPWFGADMDGDSLPLEARQEAAISMDKGCYMGQETVSRIVFRGHVNKLLVGIKGRIAPGEAVTADGREIGKVTSVAGDTGLAVVRYEDAKPGRVDSGELFLYDRWPASLKKS